MPAHRKVTLNQVVLKVNRIMQRLFSMSAGIALLLMGTISMISPIPGGVFLLSAGSVLLICASPWFRRCLQFLRARYTFFNRIMNWTENKMGQRIGSILKLTKPGYEPKPGDHG